MTISPVDFFFQGDKLGDPTKYYLTYVELKQIAIPDSAGAVLVGGRSSLDDGGGGIFIWDGEDHSATGTNNVPNDPGEGVYVPPDSDTTGASGAWVRQHDAELDVRWWGAIADYETSASPGTDASSAIQACIDYALLQQPYTGEGGDNSFRSPAVVIPAGRYNIASTLTIDLYNDGRLGDRQAFTLRGDGSNRTDLVLTANNIIGLHAVQGAVWIEGMTIQGGSGATGQTGIKYGGAQNTSTSDSEIVSQSRTQDIKMLYLLKGIEISFMFDSLFENIGMFSFASGATFVHVLANSVDNTNHLIFSRMHLERAESAVLFQANAPTTSAQRHGPFSFIGCHFETNSYDTTAIDLESVNSVTFHGCTITFNNNQGAAEADIVPVMRLTNATSVTWLGGTIGYSQKASGAVPNKLLEFEGGTYGVLFENVYFSTAQNTDPITLDTLYQTVSLTDSGLRSIKFRDVRLNSFSSVPLNNGINIGQHTRQFELDAGTDFRIRGSFAQTTTTGSPFSDEVFAIDRHGGFSSGPMLSIADAATADVFIDNDVSVNGAAIILVMADAPGDMGGMVFKRATGVFGLALGANVEASASPAAGNYGISAPANDRIRIHNEIGSTRNFTVFIVSVS